ncbi:hypothetical protein CsSME_00013083 [Camellia sinensis var. sinensis]
MNITNQILDEPILSALKKEQPKNRWDDENVDGNHVKDSWDDEEETTLVMLITFIIAGKDVEIM